MSEAVSRVSVISRLGEVVFFFVLLPALLFSMLLYTGEGETYLLFHNKKLVLATTAEEFLRQFPDGDISYQLKFAVDYVRDGSVAAWVLNLWPPGMPVLYGLILKLSGSDNFPFKIIVLSTFLYAFASYLVYRSLARGQFSPSILLACGLPLTFLTFQNSIFLDINLFSSDFYCFALMAILLSLIFKEGTQTLWRLCMIAVVLAALAYFRSFYFIFIKLLMIGGLFALSVWTGFVMMMRGWQATSQEVVQNKSVISVCLVLLFTWLLLLPWKTFLQENGRTFEWTDTRQVWAAQWRNDLPNFLVGMNTPCILEKDVCEQLMPFQHADTWATPKLGSEFYKRMSIATFISNPLRWYAEKAKFFHAFWFDGDQFNPKMPALQLLQYMESAGLLVVGAGLALVSVVRLVRNALRRRPLLEGNGLHAVFLFFCIYNLMVFTFAHYESRYSIPLKWVTYLFLVFLLKDAMQKVDLRLSGIYVHKGNK